MGVEGLAGLAGGEGLAAAAAAVAGPLLAAPRTTRPKVAALVAGGDLVRALASVGVEALEQEREQERSGQGSAQPGVGGAGRSEVPQRASAGAEASVAEPERERSVPDLALPGAGVEASAVVVLVVVEEEGRLTQGLAQPVVVATEASRRQVCRFAWCGRGWVGWSQAFVRTLGWPWGAPLNAEGRG